MRTTCLRHGRYTKGCAECAAYSARYRRTRLAGLRDGTWERMVTGKQLQKVRRHLKKLLATPGITAAAVGRCVGLAHHTVCRVAKGTNTRIGPQIAQDLLAVTMQMCLEHARMGDRLPSVGVQRRLRGLAADGWPGPTLAIWCGLSAGRLAHLRVGINPTVHRSTHDLICALYDKIQSQADPCGPSAVVAKRAQRLGYLLPERWADEDIDDPDAQPLPPPPQTDDHVAVTRAIEACLQNPQPGAAADLPLSAKRELARHAHNRLGWSWDQLAWLFGYKGASSAQYLVDGRPNRVPKTQIKRTRK